MTSMANLTRNLACPEPYSPQSDDQLFEYEQYKSKSRSDVGNWRSAAAEEDNNSWTAVTTKKKHNSKPSSFSEKGGRGGGGFNQGKGDSGGFYQGGRGGFSYGKGGRSGFNHGKGGSGGFNHGKGGSGGFNHGKGGGFNNGKGKKNVPRFDGNRKRSDITAEINNIVKSTDGTVDEQMEEIKKYIKENGLTVTDQANIGASLLRLQFIELFKLYVETAEMKIGKELTEYSLLNLLAYPLSGYPFDPEKSCVLYEHIINSPEWTENMLSKNKRGETFLSTLYEAVSDGRMTQDEYMIIYTRVVVNILPHEVKQVAKYVCNMMTMDNIKTFCGAFHWLASRKMSCEIMCDTFLKEFALCKEISLKKKGDSPTQYIRDMFSLWVSMLEYDPRDATDFGPFFQIYPWNKDGVKNMFFTTMCDIINDPKDGERDFRINVMGDHTHHVLRDKYNNAGAVAILMAWIAKETKKEEHVAAFNELVNNLLKREYFVQAANMISAYGTMCKNKNVTKMLLDAAAKNKNADKKVYFTIEQTFKDVGLYSKFNEHMFSGAEEKTTSVQQDECFEDPLYCTPEYSDAADKIKKCSEDIRLGRDVDLSFCKELDKKHLEIALLMMFSCEIQNMELFDEMMTVFEQLKNLGYIVQYGCIELMTEDELINEDVTSGFLDNPNGKKLEQVKDFYKGYGIDIDV